MKTCSYCGGKLEKTPVVGIDESSRCHQCGGLWVPNWVVNNLVEGRPFVIQPVYKKVGIPLGNNKCPNEGSVLSVVPQDSVPEGMAAQTCLKCGWWWFPNDEIFKFQQAAVAKKNYMQLWGKSSWLSKAWPALVVLVLLGGLAGGMLLLQQPQRPQIVASEGVGNFVLNYISEGKVEIVFTSGELVRTVQYTPVDMELWLTVEVVGRGNQYKVLLENLVAGKKYTVRILGKEFMFVAK